MKSRSEKTETGPVPPKYVRTQRELAEALGMQPSNLSQNWVKKEGWPRKTDEGWDVEAHAEFIQTYLRAQQVQAGANSDLKRLKLQREVELMDLKIGALRRELIPVDELRAELTEVAGVVNQGLEEWVQWVRVEFRKTEIADKAADLRDRVKRWLVKAVGDNA